MKFIVEINLNVYFRNITNQRKRKTKMNEIMKAIEDMLGTLMYGSKRVEKKVGHTFIKVYRVDLSNTIKRLVRIDILYEDRG